jgi:hypothetical protein
MSQQSEMADEVYNQLNGGPVAAAQLVSELRRQWGPEHGVGSVHNFVREVTTCLLCHDDVQVGDVKDGEFVAWPLENWEADDRISAEMIPMDKFLDDEGQYVFRKRPAA